MCLSHAFRLLNHDINHILPAPNREPILGRHEQHDTHALAEVFTLGQQGFPEGVVDAFRGGGLFLVSLSEHGGKGIGVYVILHGR